MKALPEGFLDERAGVGEDPRMGLVKVRVVGEDIDTSRMLPGADEEHTRAFNEAYALEPPYDPRMLMVLLEHSSALRQNVDAYATNIDGHGHRFEPVLDVFADDAFERVKIAMTLDRQDQALQSGEAEREPGVNQNIEVQEPTDKEVDDMIEKIKSEMAIEKMRLDDWFRYVCDDMSFTECRRQSRHEMEVIGSAFWEILRDGQGTPARVVQLPGWTMRLKPVDKQLTEVKRLVPTASLLGTREVTVKRRFRTFVQAYRNTPVVYFKDYGDPRIMSARTGKVYETPEQMDRAEKKDDEKHVPQATEVVHFRVYTPRTPYGIPRWVGSLLSVLGSRSAEEVNYSYFDNKGIPPLAITVDGGRLTDQTVKRLETYIEEEIKGRHNFHKILIVEGETMGDDLGLENRGQMRIKFEKLTDAQQKDALFLQYDERNADKVGQTFRLPRLLRGDIRDFNRATADAALEFTEGQVFSPERNEFDDRINRTIFPDLGVRWWCFKSNGATGANPMEIVDMVSKLERIFPPKILQELVEEAFGRDFPDSAEDWVKIPLEYFKLGVRPADSDETFDEGDDRPSGGSAPASQDNAGGAAQEGQGSEQEAEKVAALLRGIRDRLEAKRDDAASALVDANADPKEPDW